METTPEGVFRIQVKKLFGNAAGVLLVSTLLASCSRSDSNPAVVSGTIDTDEVHVASRYGGRVGKILPREGDPLKAGEGICELEAAGLKARRGGGTPPAGGGGARGGQGGGGRGRHARGHP